MKIIIIKITFLNTFIALQISANESDQEFLYLIGPGTHPFTCCTLFKETNIPFFPTSRYSLGIARPKPNSDLIIL